MFVYIYIYIARSHREISNIANLKHIYIFIYIYIYVCSIFVNKYVCWTRSLFGSDTICVCPLSNSMMSRPVQGNNCLWPMPLFAVDRARSVERCHHEMTNACFSFHLLLAGCRSLMLASASH